MHWHAEAAFVVRLGDDRQAVWARHAVDSLALEEPNEVFVVDGRSAHSCFNLNNRTCHYYYQKHIVMLLASVTTYYLNILVDISEFQ